MDFGRREGIRDWNEGKRRSEWAEWAAGRREKKLERGREARVDGMN